MLELSIVQNIVAITETEVVKANARHLERIEMDIGEQVRVVIVSVTEGDDKPLKYPFMFQSADVCIISKSDLLPYVDFDIKKTKDYALRLNHPLKFFELSATTGDGLEGWYDWLIRAPSKIDT